MTVTDRIEINPKVMMGKPIIRGTRIPVELILRKLSPGSNRSRSSRCLSTAHQRSYPGRLGLWGEDLTGCSVVEQPGRIRIGRSPGG